MSGTQKIFASYIGRGAVSRIMQRSVGRPCGSSSAN